MSTTFTIGTLSGQTTGTLTGINYTDELGRIATALESLSNTLISIDNKLATTNVRLANINSSITTTNVRLANINSSILVFNNSLVENANTFTRQANTLTNLVISELDTINTNINDLNNAFVYESNTFTQSFNTRIDDLNADVNTFVTRAQSDTLGNWVNTNTTAATGLSAAQQRAVTVSALKESGVLGKVQQEINNPTSLPGDS